MSCKGWAKHGIGGNGYVFLSLYRATGEAVHLARAKAFARFIAQNLDRFPASDNPLSLFEGLAGGLHFIMDVLEPDVSYFPGYE